jgi:TonB family protein
MEDKTMREIDNNEHLKIRNPERPDQETGIALPRRLPQTVFQGWGPKLMAATLAAGTLVLSNSPAKASTTVAQTSCEDHGAVVLSSPEFSAPEGIVAEGETVLRINLTAQGQIQDLAVVQSSGNALLDYEAMRVASESRYEAAMVDCKPAADTFLYRVTFAN